MEERRGRLVVGRFVTESVLPRLSPLSLVVTICKRTLSVIDVCNLMVTAENYPLNVEIICDELTRRSARWRLSVPL